MEIVLVLLIFGVLVFLVATGKLKTTGERASDAMAASSSAGNGKKASGTIEKTYLIVANKTNDVTYEVHYASGAVKPETVGIHSSRYETLRKYEPARVGLSKKMGDDITIMYEDGHVVKCVCSYFNLEASQMRKDMLQSQKTEK